MNRAHDAQQAIDNLHLAIQHFNNITIDLIYGLPGLTNEKWKQNVDRAIDFDYTASFLLCINRRSQKLLYKNLFSNIKKKILTRINSQNSFSC